MVGIEKPTGISTTYTLRRSQARQYRTANSYPRRATSPFLGQSKYTFPKPTIPEVLEAAHQMGLKTNHPQELEKSLVALRQLKEKFPEFIDAMLTEYKAGCSPEKIAARALEIEKSEQIIKNGHQISEKAHDDWEREHYSDHLLSLDPDKIAVQGGLNNSKKTFKESLKNLIHSFNSYLQSLLSGVNGSEDYQTHLTPSTTINRRSLV
ncbi:MAG: hypothetical protein SFT81_01225 [Candidatus Caenarcaniphilales bacterium]|nr:hypothetical protein [Candidatus Caenarcaniphilales bacterium]